MNGVVWGEGGVCWGCMLWVRVWAGVGCVILGVGGDVWGWDG